MYKKEEVKEMSSIQELLAMKKKMAGPKSPQDKAGQLAKDHVGEEAGLVEVTPCIKLGSLSKRDKKKLGDMLVEVFAEIMEKAGLDGSTASDYLPDELKQKEVTKKKKARKLGVDWRQVKSKEELRGLKNVELASICKEAGIPTSLAKKQDLMDRVWGINHPEDAPKVERKKRGRRPKVVVEDDGSSDSSSSSDSSDDEGQAGGEEQKVGDSTTSGSVPVAQEAVSGEDAPTMDLEEIRLDGDKLDPKGKDVYQKFKGTNFVVTSGEDGDVEYVGTLEGDEVKRTTGEMDQLEFRKFLEG